MTWNIKKLAQDNNIESMIREELIRVPAIQKLFKEFEVSFDRLNELRIEITELDKKYAETDSETMRLNKSMFQNGWEDFKKNHFFVVAHEIVHWLSRIREEDSYFNDPEEVLGFVASIAYELSIGTHRDEIYNKVYPKIEWHFNDPNDAREFFANMFQKASRMV